MGNQFYEDMNVAHGIELKKVDQAGTLSVKSGGEYKGLGAQMSIALFEEKFRKNLNYEEKRAKALHQRSASVQPGDSVNDY